MAYDLHEQEQLDELKAFWQRWGGTVLSIVVIALLVWSGLRVWNWYQARQSAEAASLAATLSSATRPNADPAAIEKAWDGLRDAYPDTIQASMGALETAAALSRAGKAEAAEKVLTWLAERGRDPEYRSIGRLRLAGLQIDRGALDAAWKTLADGDPKASGPEMEGAFADRRGDVLVAQGKSREAAAEYDVALKNVGASSPMRSVVQLKREALQQ